MAEECDRAFSQFAQNPRKHYEKGDLREADKPSSIVSVKNFSNFSSLLSYRRVRESASLLLLLRHANLPYLSVFPEDIARCVRILLYLSFLLSFSFFRTCDASLTLSCIALKYFLVFVPSPAKHVQLLLCSQSMNPVNIMLQDPLKVSLLQNIHTATVDDMGSDFIKNRRLATLFSKMPALRVLDFGEETFGNFVEHWELLQHVTEIKIDSIEKQRRLGEFIHYFHALRKVHIRSTKIDVSLFVTLPRLEYLFVRYYAVQVS